MKKKYKGQKGCKNRITELQNYPIPKPPSGFGLPIRKILKVQGVSETSYPYLKSTV